MCECVCVSLREKEKGNEMFSFECEEAGRPTTHTQGAPGFPESSPLSLPPIQWTFMFMKMSRCLGVGLRAHLWVGVGNMQMSFQSTPPTHLQTLTDNSWQRKDLNTVTQIFIYV